MSTNTHSKLTWPFIFLKKVLEFIEPKVFAPYCLSQNLNISQCIDYKMATKRVLVQIVNYNYCKCQHDKIFIFCVISFRWDGLSVLLLSWSTFYLKTCHSCWQAEVINGKLQQTKNNCSYIQYLHATQT